MGLVIIHYTLTSPYNQRSRLRPVTSKETVVKRLEFNREKEVNDPGIRFSKVPVSTIVLPLFAFKIKASIMLKMIQQNYQLTKLN